MMKKLLPISAQTRLTSNILQAEYFENRASWSLEACRMFSLNQLLFDVLPAIDCLQIYGDCLMESKNRFSLDN